MTLRELIYQTKNKAPNRILFAKRDVKYKRIHIIKKRVYSKSTKRLVTTFEIYSSSNPHYKPYTRYKKLPLHQYDVYIRFHTKGISLDSKVSLRTGSDLSYIYNPPKNEMQYLRPKTAAEYNIKRRGINPDFYFRQSWVRKQKDVLFGINRAPKPTSHANPTLDIWLTKHEWAVIHFLMEKNILQDNS